MSDGTTFALAAISGGVALTSAALSLHGVRLAHRLEQEREARTKAEQVEQLMARYRDPMVRAAFDLQSRLFNILRQDPEGFLSKYYGRGNAAEKEYAVESTLHVIGEYLGWVEILRREVQFLDLQDVARNRELNEKLDAISSAFYVDTIDPVFRIFRSEQRAIGEVMMTGTPDEDHGGRECLGYASFVSARRAPDFSRWFAKLEADIGLLAEDPSVHRERLIRLQHALIDVVDFLDPEFARFPRHIRTKLEVAVPANEPVTPTTSSLEGPAATSGGNAIPDPPRVAGGERYTSSDLIALAKEVRPHAMS
jgi:hypothetical protein